MTRTRKKGSGENLRITQKFWNVLKKQAAEFCRETGLHGYGYISQTHRSIAERIVWTMVVFTSLCCAIVLMKFAWNYYASHPLFTVIESTHHGIWKYPFPAITVCDNNRVSLNLTRQLVDTLEIPSKVSKEFVVQEMRLLNELLIPGYFGPDVRRNLSRLQDIIDRNGLSILAVVNLVTRSCDSMFESCKWKTHARNCSELFKRSVSRTGLCCSFNYITLEESVINPNVRPQRVTSCGYQTGLSMLLNLDPEDYHSSVVGSTGVKVMVHDPYDYPDVSAPYKLIEMGVYSSLTIQPFDTFSTAAVRNLDIATRNCIFTDENDEILTTNEKFIRLTFAQYSYGNCMTECRASIIKMKCGCIPYYYPQNHTRICNLKDVTCLLKYRPWYENSWPGINTDVHSVSRTSWNLRDRPCKCTPDCNFYRFSLQNSQGKLDRNVYYNGLQFTRNSRGNRWKNHSIIHAFFNDLVSMQYRRNVHYNWRNLFASFGGLLGLFAGFSLMSAFELVYFFVIRLIMDAVTKRKKRRKS